MKNGKQSYPNRYRFDQNWIDNEIKFPIDNFKWQVEILNVKQALMKEVTEKEATIRKQAAVIKSQKKLINKFGMVHQTHFIKPFRRKKDQRFYNEFNSSYNGRQNTNRKRTNRKMSKSRSNLEEDPMDFWEWNGTQWINSNPNLFEPTAKEKTDVQSNSSNLTTNSYHENTANVTIETVNTLLVPQNNNGNNLNNWAKLPSPNTTDDPQIANESNIHMPYTGDSGLTDYSISFEDHELRNHSKHLRHEEDILPQAKRPRK